MLVLSMLHYVTSKLCVVVWFHNEISLSTDRWIVTVNVLQKQSAFGSFPLVCQARCVRLFIYMYIFRAVAIWFFRLFL